MNLEEFEQKVNISRAAVDLYIKGQKYFTIKNIAKETGLKAAEVYPYFDNKEDMLIYFYNSIVSLYQLMIEDIDEFNTFTAGEKLSNFTFTLFDLLNEQKEFVRKTYTRYVIIGYGKSTLKSDVSKLFRSFIKKDERISTLNHQLFDGLFIDLLSRKYLSLILLWLNDKSASQEKTMALVDKLSSFFDELLYSNVLDKGFDLVQYLYSNEFFKFDIPYINNILDRLSKE